MAELLPCPFCGGDGKILHGRPNQQIRGARIAFVQCRVCHAKTETITQCAYMAWQDVDKYAIKAWNRRADNG